MDIPFVRLDHCGPINEGGRSAWRRAREEVLGGTAFDGGLEPPSTAEREDRLTDDEVIQQFHIDQGQSVSYA